MGSKENDKKIQLERKEQEDKKFKTAPKCQLMWITKKMLKRKKKYYNDKKEKKRYKARQ